MNGSRYIPLGIYTNTYALQIQMKWTFKWTNCNHWIKSFNSDDLYLLSKLLSKNKNKTSFSNQLIREFDPCLYLCCFLISTFKTLSKLRHPSAIVSEKYCVIFVKKFFLHICIQLCVILSAYHMHDDMLALKIPFNILADGFSGDLVPNKCFVRVEDLVVQQSQRQYDDRIQQ